MYAQRNSGDGPYTRTIGTRQRPVKKRQFCASMANFITIEEMIGRDIILIHSFLHEAQAEDLRIKRDILGNIPGDGTYMMDTTELHVNSPCNSDLQRRSVAAQAFPTGLAKLARGALPVGIRYSL